MFFVLVIGVATCAYAAGQTIRSKTPVTEQALLYKFPIHGTVFEDVNGNGKFDSGEPVLANIPVSEGRTIFLTGKDGRFKFDNKEQSAKYVFICLPEGFEKRLDFYRILIGVKNEQDFEFPLKRVAQKEDESEFTFAQVTDIHVSGPATFTPLQNALQEIADSEPRPSFIIATGDNVGLGDDENQMATYQKAVQASPIPIFNVSGNHDRSKGADRSLAYNKFLGPDYYSFNHGAFHFLIINNAITSPLEESWLREDIEKLVGGRKILAFQHYPPYEDAIQRLMDWGVFAVFSGHWHSSKLSVYRGMRCYNLPPLLMGGIDLSPSGFRLVRVTGEGLTTEFRPNGVRDFIHVSSPANQGTILSHLPFRICVAAYDSRHPFNAFTAIVESEGLKKEFPLKKESPLSWISDPINMKPGQYSIAIKPSRQVQNPPAPVQFRVVSNAKVETIPPTLKTEWTSFMGGASHHGVTSDTLTPPLLLDWIAPSGGTIDLASPIVAGGKVFIGIKDRNGSGPNGVLAIEAATGSRVWFAETATAVNHSPAFYRGRVIAQEMGGRVHAFDAKDGHELWLYDCKNADFRWLYGAPAIANGRVYAGSSRWFAALDAETGRELWHNSDGYDWISSYCSPSVASDKILNGGNWLTINRKKHGVYGMDIATGKTLWGCDCAGVHGGASIEQDKFYFNDIEGNFCMAGLSTGEILWKHPMIPQKGKWINNWSPVTPAIKGDIAITGSSDGTVYAIDIKNKKKLWEFKTGSSLFRCASYNTDYLSLLSSPIISGNLVYMGSGDGRIYALDIKSGEKKWEYELGVPVLSTPAISGNRLFVGAYDGNVYGFIKNE